MSFAGQNGKEINKEVKRDPPFVMISFLIYPDSSFWLLLLFYRCSLYIHCRPNLIVTMCRVQHFGVVNGDRIFYQPPLISVILRVIWTLIQLFRHHRHQRSY